MAVEIVGGAVPDFAGVFDVSGDLDKACPNWQEVLVGIAKEHAQSKMTTGENDPTSRMLPGSPPVTASRVHPTVLAEQASWLIDFCHDTATGLARLVFGQTYHGAGVDTASLFDFNVADLSRTSSDGTYGEPHVDSPSGAGLLCISAGTQEGYALTQFMPDNGFFDPNGAVELRLEPGQIAFFNGNRRTHRAVERVPASRLALPALRVTAAINFWGENEFDPSQRAAHNATLYP